MSADVSEYVSEHVRGDMPGLFVWYVLLWANVLRVVWVLRCRKQQISGSGRQKERPLPLIA
jgi:hypothetical protein